mgnify:CR=1 FL=1
MNRTYIDNTAEFADDGIICGVATYDVELVNVSERWNKVDLEVQSVELVSMVVNGLTLTRYQMVEAFGEAMIQKAEDYVVGMMQDAADAGEFDDR